MICWPFYVWMFCDLPLKGGVSPLFSFPSSKLPDTPVLLTAGQLLFDHGHTAMRTLPQKVGSRKAGPHCHLAIKYRITYNVDDFFKNTWRKYNTTMSRPRLVNRLGQGQRLLGQHRFGIVLSLFAWLPFVQINKLSLLQGQYWNKLDQFFTTPCNIRIILAHWPIAINKQLRNE